MPPAFACQRILARPVCLPGIAADPLISAVLRCGLLMNGQGRTELVYMGALDEEINPALGSGKVYILTELV